MFRLIDSGWESVFRQAASTNADELLIVCPFIKAGPIQRLLDHSGSTSIRVLTRLSERDLYDGVSDLAALELLLRRKAIVRGIKNLHAKLFVFGNASVVAGSANLTEAAWRRNLEFGFTSGQPEVIAGCREYFESLWRRTGTNLTESKLKAMRTSLERAKEESEPRPSLRFQDHGEDLGWLGDDTSAESLPGQSFVKFFGEGSNRESLDTPIEVVVQDDGSHYACAYSKGRRPRKVKDGDIMFLGRFVPGDLLIYGRAIARAYVEDRDDAKEAEIAYRSWKREWPHYIRVHSPEFIAGPLGNGVSLNALMAELGPYCFRSTRDRVLAGETGVTPTSAYRQQPQVELTPQGWAWMTEALQAAFAKHGRLDDAFLKRLDWPEGSIFAEASR